MTMQVYWGSGSPYSWRVLLTLEVKRIAYESRQLEFSKGDTKTPAFLAISPRGKVPAIVDGDFTLSESLAIMAYLDRKYPDPPLFGRSAEETGRIWKAISDSVSYLEPEGGKAFLPILFGRGLDQVDKIKEAVGKVRAELAVLETALSKGQWLVGDRISAADIAIYPYIELLLRAAAKDAAKPFDIGVLPFAERFPGLEAWRLRIMALPGYGKTYPPHWRAAA